MEVCSMCGVASIVYGRENPALGREAGALVRHLEYRGYDSTGVATVTGDDRITLKKRVGAPSRVVAELGIESLAGRKAIGQVRWATYGSVTDVNAQPHEVQCRVHMVGAHNGNISNTDALKEMLRAQGHAVVSDNDGEMLVHVVEHHFAEQGGLQPELSAEARAAVALRAIREAHRTVVGSYAACVAFPGIDGVFAMKAGSSLYAGKGTDGAGDFVVVSSDLTSVLSKTRFLIPLAEGEGLHFTHDGYRVFSLSGDAISVPPLRRSRLSVADIALQPPFRHFMEQEIAQAASNLDAQVRYYFAREDERSPFAALERQAGDVDALVGEVLALSQQADESAQRNALGRLRTDPRLARLVAALPAGEGFVSDEAALLADLRAATPAAAADLQALDAALVWKKKRQILQDKAALLALVRDARQVVLVGAGTSHHACLTAAVFFDAFASVTAHCANPGFFRSAYLGGLREGDLLIGVTQSGETKDLVDVFNEVRERHGRAVHLVSLVNNENSTIPQEKSELFLPLLCGPEIAVAATKSFVSQLSLFYLLARGLRESDEAVCAGLQAIRRAVAETRAATQAAVADAAERLCLRPSLHILGTSLIGLAREGALKVREVVLNHTEGYDAAEFKHGPNTILGKNTIFGTGELQRAFADGARGGRFDGNAYFSNYPLVFVCPPDERDIRITISQIHTHKIRGADVVLIAEENADLRRAIEGRPTGVPGYDARYVVVPSTGDRHAFVFQAAVVLQQLALQMSILKAAALDALGILDHGVHPDVPKNVSKSITVD
jgi:glucosamine--fructose-6-phosphate aminotransferase (isomerizing)